MSLAAARGSRSSLTMIRARRMRPGLGGSCEAMVLLGETIVATGAARELRERYPVEQTIELDGVLLPGFNDAHAHPTMTAESLLHVDCSPEVVGDVEELARRLSAEAAALEPGSWVVGSRYDPAKTTGGVVLDRHALDRMTGAAPTLLVHVASHWGVLNSAGLAAAGLDAASADPSGGRLGRSASGELTGVVYEQALFDVAFPSLARGGTVIPPSGAAERLRGLRRAFDMFHAAGVTSVCDALCGPSDLDLLSRARAADELTMRTGVLVAHPFLDDLRALGLHSGFGDSRLRLVGIKAFVDGACAGGNCLVDEPYVGTSDHGMQVIEQSDLDRLVHDCRAAGLAIAVHANGDRAIRMLLDAHERHAEVGGALRHRIEHCSLIDDEILRRIRALGLVTVPFGSYARYHADKLEDLYGVERLDRLFAHRSMLDAGITVAGSGDYPCGPLEPLAALASCTQRRGLDGRPVGLSQRIEIAEAVDLYTHGAACASGEEAIKGRLEPGMLADFVELSADPYEIELAALAEIDVMSTWVGGRPVYVRGR